MTYKVNWKELRKLSQDEQILKMRELLIEHGTDVVDPDSEEFVEFFAENKERLWEMILSGEIPTGADK